MFSLNFTLEIILIYIKTTKYHYCVSFTLACGCCIQCDFVYELPALFRESQLPTGCGVDLYFFTFVWYSYDLNTSSRVWSRKIRTDIMRQSCGFRAGTTGFFGYRAKPVRTEPETYRSARKWEKILSCADRLLNLHVYAKQDYGKTCSTKGTRIMDLINRARRRQVI